MNAILNFFIDIAPLIYILLAIGLIFGLRRLAKANNEKREAVYGLEREIAQGHANQAITTLTIIGAIAVAEFVLIVFLRPIMPAIFQLPVPTNAVLTPVGTYSAGEMETTLAQTPGTTPVELASGCVPGQVNISSPKAGTEIKGSVEIDGDANIANFGFYKYEFAPYGSDNWSAVEASRTNVQNGKLGTWDTSAILPGDYQLRLVVLDNQGNALPACVVTVRIKAP